MDDDEAADRLIDEFTADGASSPDRLLPLLRYIQDSSGYLSKHVIERVAQALNISNAEVFGVVSFYDDLSEQPCPTTVDICGAEACQALGCQTLHAELAQALHTTDVKLRTVYCLGNCTVGPNARIGDQIVGRATVGRVTAMLDDLIDDLAATSAR